MSFFGNNNPSTTQSGFSFGTGGAAAGSGTGFGFGAKPAAASTGGGLFGNTTTTTQASTGFGAPSGGGGGLFGAASSQPAAFGKPSGGGLFGGGSTALSTATTQASAGGFSFSTPTATKTTQPTLGGGFNFSTPTPAAPASAPSTGFSLSNPAGNQASTGFGLASANTTAKSSSGFSFTNTAAAPTQSSGFSFNSNAAPTVTSQASSSGFSFPTSTPAAAQAPASVGFAFNPPSAPKAATESIGGGFKLGGALNLTSKAPASGGGFQLSTNKPAGDATKSATQTQFGLGAKPTVPATPTTPSLGLGLGSGTTASSGFQLSSATASSKPSTGFFSSTAASTAPASGGLLGGLSTSTASTGLKLGLSSTATSKLATISATTGGFQLGASATNKSVAPATTTTAASDASGSLRFKDLEVMINKWTSELEQQERSFIDQATHVNGWNKLLIDNSHKITDLHDEFEKMQCDQERLNQDLDFIKTQQQELEDLIRPLEETLRQQSAAHMTSIHTHHADLEREKTFGLVANIDGQLKHMVGDLREIIDHINTTSLSSSDNTNPINQISKILSAHMDSLQWLDSNSSNLENKLEDLSKQVNDRKQEQESKFRLAFD